MYAILWRLFRNVSKFLFLVQFCNPVWSRRGIFKECWERTATVGTLDRLDVTGYGATQACKHTLLFLISLKSGWMGFFHIIPNSNFFILLEWKWMGTRDCQAPKTTTNSTINSHELVVCGLLWCFYQLFGLSFWQHPFTAEDPLVSKWCNATFLQICFDEETNSSISCIAWGQN